ncbi:hypothetical protein R7V75_02470 [Mesomycoplasma ovipneumoniae]|uniref:ICEF-II n=1 Tax=Mesomycoplasma ovipneumoniae TaxID=29562 RepID=A0AAJ2P3M3_9BACT|nr:hypothetical protein [Mesomycoplasma ovipneumoniae]MDW2892826.1 hypothetical protein [Mesomycoplasma ovipneumoniae]MDW2908579.1 hypothetical protein [Mesomycoplasma ovipneumoniae]
MKNTIFKVLPILVFSSSIFFNLSAVVEPNYIKKDQWDTEYLPVNNTFNVEEEYNVDIDLDESNKGKWEIEIFANTYYSVELSNRAKTVIKLDDRWFNRSEFILNEHNWSGYNRYSKQLIKMKDGTYSSNKTLGGINSYNNFVHHFNNINFEKSINEDTFFTFLDVNIQNKDYSKKYNIFLNTSSKKGVKQKLIDFFNNLKNSKNENWDLNNFKLNDFKLYFEYTVQNNKIIKIKTIASGNYSAQEQNITKNEKIDKLNKYLANISNSFESNFKNKFSIPTDTGAEKGINAPAPKEQNPPNNNLKSNKTYFHNLVNGWFDKVKTQNDNSYKASFWYNYDSFGNPTRAYIKFTHPIDNQIWQYELSNNIKTEWVPTEYFRQKEFSDRLKFIPSQIYKYSESYKGLYRELDQKKDITDQDEEAKKLKEESSKQPKESGENLTYGGKFEFLGDVKVQFAGNKEESEIMYINDKPVDVLNSNFEAILQDLGLEDKENGGINTYKIEIKKFKRDNNTKENKEVEKTYRVDIVIKSIASVLEGKWFAWDPERNKEQKELISPTMLDANGNEVKDSDNNPIQNPNYDPFIDPKTGTKKQLIWVNSDNNLFDNSIFYPDNSLIQKGFIAEASVVGKGINLVFAKNFENDKPLIKRYAIDKNQTNKFVLGNNITYFSSNSSNSQGEEINIYNNQNNYFSKEGLWLYRTGFKQDNKGNKGQNGFKIFLIGDNDNKKLFTDLIDNSAFIPFWASPAGQNLSTYLRLVRKFSQEKINKLSYEAIMSYWKSFINYKLDQGKIIDPVQVELERKLDKAIEEYLKKNQANINQKINLDLDLGKLIDVLSENQKIALNISDSSNKARVEFELKSNHDNKYIFELSKSQDLNLNRNFQFLNPKLESVIQKEKNGKTEINLRGSIEKGIEELLKENPNISKKQLQDLIPSKLSQWVNNSNIYSIFKLKDNSKFEIEFGSFDENLYLSKNKFEFDLDSLQEKAIENQNIFDQLPEKIINLKGITDSEKAVEYIKNQIKDLSNSKLVFNKDFRFSSIDPLLKNEEIFRPQNGNPNNLEFARWIKLGLEGIKLPGFAKLKIVNVVANNRIPKMNDLSSINLGTIKIDSENQEEIAKQIIDGLNNQLEKYNLNLKDYFKELNLTDLLNTIKNNKLSNFTLEPNNFLTTGNLKFNVDNFKFDLNNPKEFEFNSENNEFSSSKLWIIPIILISVISLGLIGIFIYRRKIKRYNS